MEMPPDWAAIAAELERLLKLRAATFGMKLFRERAQMEAIPKIRRLKAVHTMGQIVAQAARLGWTVGVCADDRTKRSRCRRWPRADWARRTSRCFTPRRAR